MLRRTSFRRQRPAGRSTRPKRIRTPRLAFLRTSARTRSPGPTDCAGAGGRVGRSRWRICQLRTSGATEVFANSGRSHGMEAAPAYRGQRPAGRRPGYPTCDVQLSVRPDPGVAGPMAPLVVLSAASIGRVLLARLFPWEETGLDSVGGRAETREFVSRAPRHHVVGPRQARGRGVSPYGRRHSVRADDRRTHDLGGVPGRLLPARAPTGLILPRSDRCRGRGSSRRTK